MAIDDRVKVDVKIAEPEGWVTSDSVNWALTVLTMAKASKKRFVVRGLVKILGSLCIGMALLWVLPLRATHIVGGEMYYECLGNDQYQITLKVYRDCYLGDPLLDNPGAIGIYDGDGNFIRVEYIPNPKISNLPIILDDPCFALPPYVCVEEGIYTQTITLPPNATGYYLAYQRCCRNHSILNLVNPGDQGATYTSFIPASAQVQCNSSPRFSNFPPIAICVNELLFFDHSATDPDGDSLVYKLCTPLQGADTVNSQPSIPSGPPYKNVIYAPGYSASYPMEANPGLAIDPKTGLLSGTPTLLGQFVVGVCVEEYRNEVLIGTHRREFQFNVTICSRKAVAKIPIPTVGDTSINQCSSFSVTFGNNSIGATSYLWDFGVVGVTNDTSNVRYPTFTYPDSGTYQAMLIVNPSDPCSDTDRVTIRVYPTLEAKFRNDGICAKTAINFIDDSYSDIGSLIDWSWNFGDGNSSSGPNPNHTYSAGGTYPVTLTVTNSVGCTATAHKDVTVNSAPTANYNVDGYCVFKEIGFVDTSLPGSDKLVKWEWFLEGGIPLDSTPATSHIFQDSGSYSVTLVVTSENGCTDTITKVVKINGQPAADAWGDTTVCPGEPVQLYGGGGSAHTWGSSNGSLISTDQNPMVHPLETTTYVYTASNDCHFDTAHVTVEVFPPPDLEVRPDTNIMKGQSVLVYASSADGTGFQWVPDDGTFDPTAANFEVTLNETTTYTVTTQDKRGCKNSKQVTIFVNPVCDRLFIPTAFSPNGDGRNDRFAPQDYGQNSIEMVRIYNRWGKLVYETENLEQGWDGAFNGIPQDVGTYIYIIEGICEQQRILHKGNVTLLR